MAKWPRPGRVKTRLQRCPREAALLYRAFLEDTIRTVDQVASGIVSVADAPSLQDAQSVLPSGLSQDWSVQLQGQGDLGQRIQHAFFEMGLERSVVTGSDLPTLRAADLAAVLAELELGTGRKAVVLPSSDGGYSVIGLRGACPELFQNIAWSTDHVLAQTREAARGADIAWIALSVVDDVDTPDDLQALRGKLPPESRTRAVLQSLAPSALDRVAPPE